MADIETVVPDRIFFGGRRAQSGMAPGHAAACIILVFTALRLLLLPVVGLSTNEAYAIASGRHLALSYFDHPPLHFWLARISAGIFGDGTWARVPFIALGAGTSWLMFRLTSRLFGPAAGLWALLALNLSIYFSLVAGTWILPDGPLDFFLLATAVALVPLAGDCGSMTPRRWMAAGLCLGLAALSKYHAVLFALSVFGYLLSDRQRRRVLLTPWPYVAAAISLAIFSPVILWNFQHDWISFRFQAGRASPDHLNGGIFLSLLISEIAALGPWMIVPLAASVWRADWRDSRCRFFLWTGLPTMLLLTFVPIWGGQGMLDWPMPGWLLLYPLCGVFLAGAVERVAWPRWWAAGSAIALLLFCVIAGSDSLTGWFGEAFPRLLKHGDPTIEMMEWSALPQILKDDGLGEKNYAAVLAFNWRDAAKLDQAFNGRLPVLVYSSDPRNFAFFEQPESYLGGEFLIVAEAKSLARKRPELSRYFSLRSSVPLVLGRDHRTEINLAAAEARLTKIYARPSGLHGR